MWRKTGRMFSSSHEKASDGTLRRQTAPQPDMKAVGKGLEHLGLEHSFLKLINNDDAPGLQEVLEAVWSYYSSPSSKKVREKCGKNLCCAFYGSKEAWFAILGRRLVHYASKVDAVNCCRFLLTSKKFRTLILVDAVYELDQRSALHVASRYHSRGCIEVLLKHGANVSLKNKHGAVPFLEALLSARLDVDWDFVTPAIQILEEVRAKDLAALRMLEGNCQDHLLVQVAFQLAKGLKLVPLIALLLVARSSLDLLNVVEPTSVKGLEEDSTGAGTGTLVDVLVEKAITFTSPKVFKNTAGNGEGTCRLRKDASETWDGINSTYSRNLGSEGASTSSSFRRSFPGPKYMNWKGMEGVQDRYARSVGKDVGTGRKIAQKLLECVILFDPRLSAHPQSQVVLSPLLRAAKANDHVLLSLLLKSGPQPGEPTINESDFDGNTALHSVLRWSTLSWKQMASPNVGVVRRQLKASANVLLGDKSGVTAVHTSAGRGHSEALNLNLCKSDEGAAVNMMTLTKETLLCTTP